MRIAIPLIALCLAVPALARDKAPPAGTVIGAPVSCINVRNIRDTDRVDDRTIIFKMTNRRYYRNVLPQSCPRLADSSTAISYKVSVGQLCSVDIIQIVDTAGSRLQTWGACGLGKFEPWQPAPKAKG